MNHNHVHTVSSGLHEMQVTLAMTATYMIAEVVGGYLTNSLALLADAGHMLSDVGSLTLSLLAMRFALKQRTQEMTYGYYRAEILAALVNGVTLVVVSIFIFYEAFQRFQLPPKVQSGPMIIVASIGLIVNLVSVLLLSKKKDTNLNVHSAFLHVLADTMGSVGAIAAGIIMLMTGWYLADPIISVVIGFLILFSSWRVLKESVMVLMEGTPNHIDINEIETVIKSLPGVLNFHDLHVWTVTSGFISLSVHVNLHDCRSVEHSQSILKELRDILHERFGIEHTTIQIEQGEPECSPPSTC
jgi:cobalt-zinc-cadmium efflux system protein